MAGKEVIPITPGQRFGMLTTVSKTKLTTEYSSWHCVCDCGLTTIKSRPSLLHPRYGTTSLTPQNCGCKRSAILRERLTSSYPLCKQYNSYKGAARKCGREWALTKEEFLSIASKNCHYCGEPPKERTYSTSFRRDTKTLGERRTVQVVKFTSNGVDRIDSSEGYRVDNCVPCCSDCNWAKRTRTPEEFVSHSMKVAMHSMPKKATLRPAS